MAIQEIEINKIQGSAGHKKKIDAGAKKMVFDILQATQYQKPEESTVRELVSNAVDSQREKEIAIEILDRKANPEKYFITREGEQYKDSNWAPTYYNLGHLDQARNHVDLVYTENQGVGFCDEFTVTDYGVGIGDSRLEGIVSLGFSTKRNNKAVLGAWGLGAKSALSLRCDYFTIETVHNGKKFILNCYAYKTDFVIGKFNLETEKENKFITLSDGTKVYYEESYSKNYTKIKVPTKRHHRSKFKEAIQSQLLYFKDVRFKYCYEDEEYEDEEIDFLADVTYNSDNIIISDNRQFSRPHIIIVKGDDAENRTGVCYGYIDFRELEMQQLYGNIGVKCPIRSTMFDEETQKEIVLQEGVSVTPSRESVIWDDHTRDFLKKRFGEVLEEANEIITSRLNEDDFMKWIENCTKIISNISNDPTLSKMCKLVESSSLKPKFPKFPTIQFTHPQKLFWGFKVKRYKKVYDHRKKRDIIERTDIENWSAFRADHVFIKSGSTVITKDMYITSMNGDMTVIEINDFDKSLDKIIDSYKEGNKKWTKKLEDNYIKVFEYLKNYFETALKDEHSYFHNYDEYVVPKDWAKDFEETEGKLDEEQELTPELRRQFEKRTVAYHPRPDRRNDGKKFTFTKIEPKISELMEDPADIYYGSNEDVEKIHAIAEVLRFYNYGYTDSWSGGCEFDTSDFKLLKIGLSNLEYVNKFQHVDRFFKTLIKDTVVMDDRLTKWYTAYLINEVIDDDLLFFANYSSIHSELSEMWRELRKYRDTYYTHVSTHSYGGGYIHKECMPFFEKLLDMQLHVQRDPNDDEGILKKSKELFGIPDVKNAIGVEQEIYNKLQILIEYAEPVKDLFNNINNFTNRNHSDISNQQELLIKEILQARKLDFT